MHLDRQDTRKTVWEENFRMFSQILKLMFSFKERHVSAMQSREEAY